jgi:DNA-binding NarL/FixJ family response regulator
MIKILIVEDQTMLRESLEHVIGGQNDMEAASSTDDAANAPEQCRRLKPDLVLMDVVTKNNSSGIIYTAQIRKEFPKIKIVIMTALPEITFAEEARKAGAHSFIDKGMGNDHLFHVIRNTMKGYSIYSSLSDRMPFAARFTEKEIAVIRLVWPGNGAGRDGKKPGRIGINDQTAYNLNIGQDRLRQHFQIRHIRGRRGVNSAGNLCSKVQ